jgi:hypothetical protein
VRRIAAVVRKCRDESISTPRHAKRGQSEMVSGSASHQYSTAGAAAAGDHTKSCEKVSSPRMAPHCVAALSVASPLADTLSE